MNESRQLTLLRNFMEQNEIGVEELLQLCAEWIESDKDFYIARAKELNGQPHKGIVSCLESAIEHCNEASLAYYASTK